MRFYFVGTIKKKTTDLRPPSITIAIMKHLHYLCFTTLRSTVPCSVVIRMV